MIYTESVYFLNLFPITGRLLSGKSFFIIYAMKRMPSMVFTMSARGRDRFLLAAVMQKYNTTVIRTYTRISFIG